MSYSVLVGSPDAHPATQPSRASRDWRKKARSAPETLRYFDQGVFDVGSLAIEKAPLVFGRPTTDSLKELDGRILRPEGRKPPIMILHGDSDTGMLLDASSMVIKKFLPYVDLRVYYKASLGK